jgi:O-antigen ligase
LKNYQALAGVLARWSIVVLFFSLAISRSLFSLAGVLVLLGLVLEGRWREKWTLLKTNTPACMVIAMVTWLYLSSVWSQASDSRWQDAANVHWKLLLIPAIVLLVRNTRWQTRCWQAFATGMLLLLVHVYAVALGINSIPWVSSSLPDRIFFNPQPQSVGLALFSGLCLSYLFDTHKRLYKFWFGMVFLVSSFAVLSISQQRLGYLMWAIACFLIVFLKLKPVQKKWGFLIATSLLLIIFLNSTKIQDRVNSAIQEVHSYYFQNNFSTSVGARLRMWHGSTQAIGEAPFIGHGLGSYPELAEAFFKDQYLCSIGCIHPHNQYLFYAVEFGLIGLSLLVLMLYRVLTIHRALEPSSTMPMVVLTVFALSGLVESTLWYRGFVYLFVPLLALSMINSNQKIRFYK